MTGLVIIVLGLAAGLMGYLLLRRSGTGWRVGRLLAAAPERTLAQAAAIAAAARRPTSGLHGRVDSDEEFPGDDGKPLVYRRRRLQQRSGRSGWQTFDDERLAVPFRLSQQGRARGDRYARRLGDGLVVVPRESEGVAADVTAEAVSGGCPSCRRRRPCACASSRSPRSITPSRPACPGSAATAASCSGPGLGRPLVLTTLELDEAMRVLAGGRRRELLVASGLLIAAPLVVGVGLIALVLGL